MEKSDKIIEILAWIIIVMILGFFLWINYELSVTEGDGMHIADEGCRLDSYNREIIGRCDEPFHNLATYST